MRYAAWWLLSLVIINAAAVASLSYLHSQRVIEAHSISEKEISSLTLHLNNLMQFGIDELNRLAPSVIEANGDSKAIYAELKQLVDDGKGVVRFAWSDASGALKVSSVKGIHEAPASVAHRGYYTLAREAPNEIHASQRLNHVSTGKGLFLLALGLQDAQSRDHGTLVATYNEFALQAYVTQLMRFSRADYAVFYPRGELLYANGDAITQMDMPAPQTQGTVALRFSALGVLSPAALNTLRQESIIVGLVVLILVNLTIVTVWYFIRQRLTRPVQHLSKALSLDSSPSGLLPQLEQLQRAMQKLDEKREDDAARDALLEETRQHLNEVKRQQQTFFNASRNELHHAFMAITSYAQHLEDQVLTRQIDPYHQYSFDDVHEIGANMKCIANSYHLIIEYTEQNTTPSIEEIDIQHAVREVVELLYPYAERRNLELLMTDNQPLHLHYDSTLLNHILWASFYLAVRFARDDSSFLISLQRNSKGDACIRLQVDQYQNHLLPEEMRDYRMFMPQFEKDGIASLMQLLEQHANTLIARSLMAICGGDISIHSAGKEGFEIALELRNNATQIDETPSADDSAETLPARQSG